MLDVERGEDVDAGGEDLLDVLIALGVLGAGSVRVGELVDQAQLGRAAQDCVQVHLLQHRLPVAHAHTRQQGQPLGELGGLGAAVCLEQSDHDVTARLQLRVTLEQHAKGLADPGGHSEEDLQVTAALIGSSRVTRRRSLGRRDLLAHPPSRL